MASFVATIRSTDPGIQLPRETVVRQSAGSPPATLDSREGDNAAPESSSEHPTRNWSTGDIIAHIVAHHHRRLEQSLASLVRLIPQVRQDMPERAKQWDKFLQRFEKLRDEVLRGAAHEKRLIFPELLHWEQTPSRTSPSTALQDEVQAVESRHARCLQFVWQLLRAAKDESGVAPGCAAAGRVVEELSSFCDEFEQCLFEEECLLFARLKPVRIGKPR